MNILIVEPYLTGSHAAWARGYQSHSRHEVQLLSLSGANWKWRMHGGAVTLARRFNQGADDPDLILATDMLDVTTFQSLTRARTARIPTAIYFHENQLSYPWSPRDRDVLQNRDKHYGFINYASALASDAVFFNSRYHLDSFFTELERLLKHFPDHNELGSIDVLREKTRVLPLGLELGRYEGADDGDEDAPLVLWNHRWEYDKNPDEFFIALDVLNKKGVSFRVAILGENFSQQPDVFLIARDRLGDKVVQFGYADDYAQWLRRAHILPVTSHQDFFGASVIEAVSCGAYPLLPRRLAYPELFPDSNHTQFFYTDFDDLVAKLTALCSGDEWRTPRVELIDHVSRYDWSKMAPVYDDTLETLVVGQ